MFSIKTNSYVDTIVMPENLRVGLLVNEYREKCKKGGCSFDYAGFAFVQSPFHVPWFFSVLREYILFIICR